MPPFNEVPAPYQQQEVKKERFNICTFDPSKFERIEDMPEEARGYFIPIPKHQGGGYFPNRKYQKLRSLYMESKLENELERLEILRDFEEEVWDNNGIAPEWDKEIEQDDQGSYISTFLSDIHGISMETLSEIEQKVQRENSENIKKALSEWETFLQSYKPSYEEIGFKYDQSNGVGIFYRPVSNSDPQSLSAEEEYQMVKDRTKNTKSYDGKRYPSNTFYGTIYDDGTRYKKGRTQYTPFHAEEYVGRMKIASLQEFSFSRGRVHYFVFTPNQEPLRVFKSSYEDYLRSMDTILLTKKDSR